MSYRKSLENALFLKGLSDDLIIRSKTGTGYAVMQMDKTGTGEQYYFEHGKWYPGKTLLTLIKSIESRIQ